MRKEMDDSPRSARFLGASPTPAARLFRWLPLLPALALSVATPLMAATTNYVTPTGGAPYDGASWATAFSNIQDAVDLAVNDGDVVYLKDGTYTNSVQIEITNAVGLTLVGGYAGNTVDGLPGELTNEASILTRASAALSP